MESLTPPRRRRRQGRKPQVIVRPPVVTACQLPFVLGYRSRDKALEIRKDPAFPRPIRQLGPQSRAVWILAEVEEWLRQQPRAYQNETPQEGPPPFRPGASADVPAAEEARLCVVPTPTVVPAGRGLVPSTASDPEAMSTPHLAGGAAECARDAGGGLPAHPTGPQELRWSLA